MKKIKILFALLLLLAAGRLYAQEYNSLLWEISGNSITQPSYLFGTEHTKDSTIFAQKDLVLEKLESCKLVISETEDSKSDVQPLLRSIYMEDETLDNLMTKEQYERTRLFFRDSLSVDLNTLKSFKPIMLVFMIAFKDNVNERSVKSEKTYSTLDDYIINHGTSNGLRHTGLENSDEFLKFIIEYYPLNEQVDLLLEAISPKHSEMIYGLKDSYENENLDELYKTAKATMPAQMFSVLLKHRNDSWLKIIPPLIDKEPAFIVVGAMHLPGEEGLINGLRKLGYTVTALKTSSGNTR
jgi:uncharacterized protein YbaP (TraB family)